MRLVMTLAVMLAGAGWAEGPTPAPPQAPACTTRCNTQASECMKTCNTHAKEVAPEERGHVMIQCVKSCEASNKQCKSGC